MTHPAKPGSDLDPFRLGELRPGGRADERERYYAIAGITLQVESDLPFLPDTFKEKFEAFAADGAGQDTVVFHHHFEIPAWTFGLGPASTGAYPGRSTSRGGVGSTWDPARACGSPMPAGSRRRLHPRPHAGAVLQRPRRARGVRARRPAFADADAQRPDPAGPPAGRPRAAASCTRAASCSTARVPLRGPLRRRQVHDHGAVRGGLGEPLCDDRNIVRRWPDGFRVHGTWSHGDVPDPSRRPRRCAPSSFSAGDGKRDRGHRPPAEAAAPPAAAGPAACRGDWWRRSSTCVAPSCARFPATGCASTAAAGSWRGARGSRRRGQPTRRREGAPVSADSAYVARAGPARSGARPPALTPRHRAHRALRQRLHPLLHQPAGAGPRARAREMTTEQPDRGARRGRRPGRPRGALHRRRAAPARPTSRSSTSSPASWACGDALHQRARYTRAGDRWPACRRASRSRSPSTACTGSATRPSRASRAPTPSSAAGVDAARRTAVSPGQGTLLPPTLRELDEFEAWAAAPRTGAGRLRLLARPAASSRRRPPPAHRTLRLTPEDESRRSRRTRARRRLRAEADAARGADRPPVHLRGRPRRASMRTGCCSRPVRRRTCRRPRRGSLRDAGTVFFRACAACAPRVRTT